MATTIASGLTFSVGSGSSARTLSNVSITADIVKTIYNSEEYLGLENITVTGNAHGYTGSNYSTGLFASETYSGGMVQGGSAVIEAIRYAANSPAFSISRTSTSPHRVARIKKGQSSATCYLQFRILSPLTNVETVTISFDPRPVLYGSVNGQTKAVQKLYGSVNGETKEIKKLYGSVNGQTKRIF